MTIDPVSSAAAAAAAGPERTDPLGRDAFLTLLVTQLEHQNPLEPQADGEFLAQLAQFSTLESLQAIKDDIAALRSLLEGVSQQLPSTDGGV